MVKKTSSKNSTSKSNKTSKSAQASRTPDHSRHFGGCITALGLVVATLLIGMLCLAKNQKTNMDIQKSIAFEGAVDSYIYEQFFIENKRTANVTGLGITDDNDLYADFIIQYFDGEHTLVSYQPARIHFQCHEADDNWKFKDSCSHAYWYGEKAETSEEYRSASRKYVTEIERLVDLYNATEDESERERITDQERAVYDEFVNAIELYGPDFQKQAIRN